MTANIEKLQFSKVRWKKVGWHKEDDHDISVFGAIEPGRFDFSHMPISYMAKWVQCLPSLNGFLWDPQNFGYPKALRDPEAWLLDLPHRLRSRQLSDGFHTSLGFHCAIG